jgi:hypothetical protein
MWLCGIGIDRRCLLRIIPFFNAAFIAMIVTFVVDGSWSRRWSIPSFGVRITTRKCKIPYPEP